jgi:hypothetical protein
VGCVLAFDGRGRRAQRAPDGEAVRLGRVLPWLLLALVAAGLGGLDLALGGHSSTVPILSTVIDHALAWHLLRLVVFCGWLLIGSPPVIRTMRRHGRRS